MHMNEPSGNIAGAGPALKEEYPYLYETHLHTCQGSRCAKNLGSEMARAAKKAGYAGIFVTEHNWGGNTGVDRNLPWKEWVHAFFKGYEDAKTWGDAHDLSVFFAYEAGYRGTEFLIYGVEPEWLLTHPKIKTATVEEQYHMIHEAGGMVIHAHPYREEPYISEVRLFPQCVDGVEGINACHSNPKSLGHYNPYFDKRAILYAREHNLPITAGSDIHTTNLLGGGVAFKRKLTSSKDYCQAILGGEEYILTNGTEWFDKSGNRI